MSPQATAGGGGVVLGFLKKKQKPTSTWHSWHRDGM